MAHSTPPTSFSRTKFFTATGHPILIIFSLVFALVAAKVLRTPKSRNALKAAWEKQSIRLYIKKCDGLCGNNTPHTHEFTMLGKFRYHWRYNLMDMVFTDPRPYPPIDEKGSAPWVSEYERDWRKQFPDYYYGSGWVRDQHGRWVWVTNTPPFDRDWFDARGWRFPAAWITGPSKVFYHIGVDSISDVVSLPKLVRKDTHATEDVTK